MGRERKRLRKLQFCPLNILVEVSLMLHYRLREKIAGLCLMQSFLLFVGCAPGESWFWIAGVRKDKRWEGGTFDAEEICALTTIDTLFLKHAFLLPDKFVNRVIIHCTLDGLNFSLPSSFSVSFSVYIVSRAFSITSSACRCSWITLGLVLYWYYIFKTCWSLPQGAKDLTL